MRGESLPDGPGLLGAQVQGLVLLACKDENQEEALSGLGIRPLPWRPVNSPGLLK